MQTNELYQLAAVAFCLLLAWVKLLGFIFEAYSVIYFSLSLLKSVQCDKWKNGISVKG
jgi:hypothetical protein